jgi:putative molybdopterin biosynthesis protein
MSSITSIHSFDQLKLLADPRRLAILQHLMSAPATLTSIGNVIGEHPAWVRHHLKKLEDVGLVKLVETRIQSGVVEKYYQACSNGYLLQELILPQDSTKPVIVFSGSHDLVIELLARKLSKYFLLLTLPVGSLDGLITLRQNLATLSGTHLLDESGEYNLPFIRRFFPDRNMIVITLAHREQGLMVAPGNPKSIHSLNDLARPDITFVNRNPGSGTRLWLDRQLTSLGIPLEIIHGYGTSIITHTECASLIKAGKADVALGLQAAAHQHGLDFLPLFEERYDIVFNQEHAPMLTPLLDRLQALSFRRQVDALTGYATGHTGEQIPL